ncbi:MAG: hypothetical protein IIC33_08520 [Chloroflexi bacterium]|nr:hypothetical protein [Chloroflexota bacterium]
MNVKLGEAYASHAPADTLRGKEAEARQDIAKAAELAPFEEHRYRVWTAAGKPG